MSNVSVDIVWWRQVSGPSLFLRQAVDALRSGRHLCLCLPNVLPWRETFFALLTDELAAYGLLFERPSDTGREPGESLVSHFGLEASYRYTKTYPQFFSQCGALQDRVVHVATSDPGRAKAWFGFSREYKPSSAHGGLMLLEAQNWTQINPPKHVAVLSYTDFVSEYDVQILTGLMLPNHSLTLDQKRYITAIAVSLTGADPVAAADFVTSYRFDRDDPEAYIGDGPPKEPVYQRVWNAQVQTIFPIIMRECRRLHTAWYAEIEDAFQYADQNLPDGLLTANGERITSPDEIVEIATLRFLMHGRRQRPGERGAEEYILYIPDEAAREYVELLYRMRNKIAHGQVCPLEDVVQLLGA